MQNRRGESTRRGRDYDQWTGWSTFLYRSPSSCLSPCISSSLSPSLPTPPGQDHQLEVGLEDEGCGPLNSQNVLELCLNRVYRMNEFAGRVSTQFSHMRIMWTHMRNRLFFLCAYMWTFTDYIRLIIILSASLL